MPALLQQARSLQHAAASGEVRPLLRGKKFGLLCERSETAPAALFCDAATALGAHVAHVRTHLTTSSEPHEVRHTARMLGLLYDALECQEMELSLTAMLAREAGVPVFDGIALPDHPTASLARLLDADHPDELARRYIVQAILLRSLS